MFTTGYIMGHKWGPPTSNTFICAISGGTEVNKMWEENLPSVALLRKRSLGYKENDKGFKSVLDKNYKANK